MPSICRNQQSLDPHGSPPPRDPDKVATASPCGRVTRAEVTLQKAAAPSRSAASMRPPPPCSSARKRESKPAQKTQTYSEGYPRWTRAGGVVASSTGCWERRRRGAPDILTPWATRGRIDFSNARCPSLSIRRALARPPACMLAMSPLGGGKTMMALDFAWSLQRAKSSAGRVRCVHNDLVCTLFNGVLSERIVLLVHSNRQRMRRGVDQNSLPESNARCTHVAMHKRPA